MKGGARQHTAAMAADRRGSAAATIVARGVDVVDYADLTPQKFWQQYVAPRKPVSLVGVAWWAQ